MLIITHRWSRLSTRMRRPPTAKKPVCFTYALSEPLETGIEIMRRARIDHLPIPGRIGLPELEKAAPGNWPRLTSRSGPRTVGVPLRSRRTRRASSTGMLGFTVRENCIFEDLSIVTYRRAAGRGRVCAPCSPAPIAYSTKTFPVFADPADHPRRGRPLRDLSLGAVEEGQSEDVFEGKNVLTMRLTSAGG